jgi:hypothetical protein
MRLIPFVDLDIQENHETKDNQVLWYPCIPAARGRAGGM